MLEIDTMVMLIMVQRYKEYRKITTLAPILAPMLERVAYFVGHDQPGRDAAVAREFGKMSE